MVHGEPRHHDVERAIGIRQRADIALVPGDVADPLLRRMLPRAIEHRRGHVDAGRMPHVRRESAHHDAAAAGDIQHRVAGPGAAASTIMCSALASVMVSRY